MAVDVEEKARVEALKKHSDIQRAKEEARRAARVELAKSQPSLIVHGPASK